MEDTDLTPGSFRQEVSAAKTLKKLKLLSSKILHSLRKTIEEVWNKISYCRLQKE